MIAKEIFCEIIESIRQQMYLDKKHGDSIQNIFNCSSRCTYNNSIVIKSIIKLLQIYFPKDDDGFCLIEHFCFFIEFGKFNEKDIISTEDLYDQLIINLNK
jgi:hypothetical protein